MLLISVQRNVDNTGLDPFRVANKKPGASANICAALFLVDEHQRVFTIGRAFPLTRFCLPPMPAPYTVTV